jgi:steroid delta-isomerase-like uncharacterized protein
MMPDWKRRLKTIRDHIRQESTHDMEGLLAGMTKDCLTDVVCVPKPYIGPKAVRRRYEEQWTGFPDFKVRVRKVIALGHKFAVTENEWTGTHRGAFMGYPPTGKRVKVRAAVAWEFRGNRLRGEYIYFDLASILRQIGALKKQ